jgi:hypothetical protein
MEFRASLSRSASASMSEKRFKYFRRCDDFDHTDVYELNKMVEGAKDSTYDTMQRHCAGLRNWALEQGYDPFKGGLTLRKDWHVSYHRSRIFGRRCYFLRWSSFEVIWIEETP